MTPPANAVDTSRLTQAAGDVVAVVVRGVGRVVWTGRQTLMVGDQLAPSTGKRTYALPTADGGTVEGKVSRTTLFNPFPALEVGGVKHSTGPEVPVALRVLMVAPILLVALGAWLARWLRSARSWSTSRSLAALTSRRVKALLMALSLAVAIAIWAVVAVTVFQ